MSQINCLRYSLFSSTTLRITCDLIMREEGAAFFPLTVLKKSLSPRPTKGCNISVRLHVALVVHIKIMPLTFPIAPSHRIARNIQDRTPLRSNQFPFMFTPCKTTHHPRAQASHIGAYLLARHCGYFNGTTTLHL